MFKRRSQIGLKGVSVKIELPVEIAEYILENADGLLSSIKQSVEVEKKRFENSSLATEFHNPERQEEWEKLARYTDREARRRYKLNKEPFNSVVSGVAKEHGVPYSTLLALVANYRERRSYGLHKRREVEIIRLYLIGWSFERIGRSLEPRMSSKAVTKVIEQNSNILRTLSSYKTSLIENKEKSQKPPVTKSNSKEIKDRANDKKAITNRHRSVTIKLYREYRKSGITSSKARYHYIKGQGEPYGLPFIYLTDLYKKRRKEIQAYIEKRRFSTVSRLHKQGLNNKQIGVKLGLHNRTIAKIVREVRAK